MSFHKDAFIVDFVDKHAFLSLIAGCEHTYSQ